MQKETYLAGARRWQDEAEKHRRRSALHSNLRGLSFGTAAIATIAGFAGAPPEPSFITATVAGIIFIVFVMRHARVLEALDLAERWVDVHEDAVRRLDHEWAQLPDTGEGLVPPDHLYSGDLDLFGKGSVFQRLSVARTRFGRERLAQLLLESDEPTRVRQRQAAVRSLSQESELRLRFEAHALGVVGSQRSGSGVRTRLPPDPGPLLAWAEGPTTLLGSPLLVWGSKLLPLISVLTLTATLMFGLSPYVPLLSLLIQAYVLLRSTPDTGAVFNAVSATEGAFLRYGTLLEIIEQYQSSDPLLAQLRERLTTKAGAPSTAMGRFRNLMSWFDLRHGGLLYPIVNISLLWDLNCSLALERWKQQAGPQLRTWFDTIGWFEALSSLSAFAADEPDVHYPELVDAGTVFEARGLSHPLLPAGRRVKNDVALDATTQALLITGSNMSGKSTLLRAMGVSCVLAQAGCPVTAQNFRVSRLTVATSIRISDSLERGVSHFLAEVSKLKRVVEAATTRAPALFLLDEILHGTNSRERQIGARWVLAELLRLGAIGVVSTHDQELCQLPDALMRQVKLVHLRENVTEGVMTFDYHLYPGPVTSGNALRLMQSVGLGVPLE